MELCQKIFDHLQIIARKFWQPELSERLLGTKVPLKSSSIQNNQDSPRYSLFKPSAVIFQKQCFESCYSSFSSDHYSQEEPAFLKKQREESSHELLDERFWSPERGDRRDRE